MPRKAFLIIAACVVAVAAYAGYEFSRDNVLGAAQEYQQIPGSSAQDAAIQQALEWRGSETLNCLTVITPAIHKDSGARYTFSDSCLPPGWEADF